LSAAIPPTFESWFAARHPEIRVAGARAVLDLAEGGATVPFIARYRKERTGNLDEVAIRSTLLARELWDRLENRKGIVLESVERQKKLTPELRERIQAAADLDTLEDLYLPYRQKRKSKAVLARDAGLDGATASVRECARIKAACGTDFRLLTPGIRPAGAIAHDQARVATPRQAVRAGADYLVVGRPIVTAPDPAAAARAIWHEMTLAARRREPAHPMATSVT